MLFLAEPEYEFVKEMHDIDAYEKEAAEFECEVNDPMAVVKWYREDKVGIFVCIYWILRQALSLYLCVLQSWTQFILSYK